MSQDDTGGAGKRMEGLSPEKRRLLLQDMLRERKGSRDRDRIPRRSAAGPVPPSFAQQRLWLVDRLEPGSAAYNMPYVLRLRGPLDVPALRASLDALVRRHEVLRTTFAERDGAPVQIVHPPASVVLSVWDLGGLRDGDLEPESERLATGEVLRPFDLERGPLLRSALLRLGEEDHVLCFTLHHVAGDGWSMRVLSREVAALYDAFSRDEEPRLPELPVQYADYAVWQREWLSGDVLRSQLGWWRERLAGAPPVLDFPTDRPRFPGQSPAAATHAFSLSAGVTRGLRELSERQGATPFMAVLAGWQALLGRYAGQEDVVVGTPVAGRSRPEVEGLIGFFVNLLPLRTDLSGDLSWTELLARVREGALGAFDRQDLPFERLVEELAVERSLIHTPLVQITFALHRASWSGERLRLGGAAAEPFGEGERVAKFDLELVFEEAGEELAGTLTYRSALFEAATMERLAGHLATVLEEMAADPRRRLSELSLLRGAERVQVLEAWNDTAAAYPRERCIHELFAARAACTPDAVALSWRGEPVTYAELERRSGRLADALRRRGVGPETRVGVCMERSPELVASLLAVLRAGGAYVPMDPGYPVERLRYMVEDSGAALLLADAAVAERLGGCGVEVVCPGEEGTDAEASASSADASPSHPSSPESLAYVVYTSGSTGRPKGVLGTHRAAVNRFAWMWSEYPFAADEVCCQKTSLAFVDSVWEVFGPLLAGVPSVLAPDDDARDPEALVALLSRHGVTRIVLVPSLLRALLDGHPDLGERCPRLRLVVTSGETLPSELARRFAEAVPGALLLNLYGSSEVAADSTHHAVRPAGAEPAGRVPIGRPIWNTRTYVVDTATEPAPRGAVGELYVAGAGLARGYMGNPAATAERFVPDPFAGAPGERMYRTGDRARWTARGELEYRGRTDQQVKVRGFRIELGEIEATLRTHPAVREAVAAVRSDARDDRRIVAYVTAREGEAISAAELRAHVGARLPEYMVPSAVVTLESLPLTPSGKTDRLALPAPEWGAEGAYAAPRTTTEEVLAGIWAEVLGAERVGVEENFFALGGHSLLATQVVSRVRQALGAEVPLRALFEAPTVAALAARVEALRSTGGSAPPPLERVSREEAPPLSFAQQRLWLVDRIEPGSAAYNMPFALRLRGALDVPALRASLDGLVRRHEALRTTFAERGGSPVQVIHPPAPVPLPTVELGRFPGEVREREAARFAAEEALRPFDLARGPLLRSTLLRLDGDDHVLCFTLHHVVSDGWSMQVLVREVSELYTASVRGEEPALPELPVQYADYAVWQRAWLAGEVLESQVGWWRERLAGAPPLLEIPTDRPRVPGLSPRAATHAFTFSPGATRGLRELSRREGATLFMTVLTGWQALLGRYAGQDDVVVGSAVAGRNRREVEGLIGFFVNMLALRTDLSGDPAWTELLARVREGALGAFDHQDLPFERLVEALAVERSLTHAPVFQTTFALRRAAGGDERVRLGDLEPEPFASGERVAQFDLDLVLADLGDTLAGEFVYRAALFDSGTISRLAEHLEAVLEAMAADPGRCLSGVSLLRESERARLLEEWSATGAAVDGEEYVHERIARQARRDPDAVAVRAAGRTLTYGELDREAARLARHLRGMGVGPETRVGLCLERSPEMVVAVLGVLRAGAAYVPLDPSYPAERLGSMLEDSAPAVLLATEGLLERLPSHGARVVCLDRDAAEIARRSEAAPETDLAPENLAYVLFTSGSTGSPRGVAVTHRGLGGYLAWAVGAYAGDGHGAPVHSSLSFDLTVTSLLVPLVRGERVVLTEEREGVAGLARALREEPGFTLVKLTPAHLALLAEQLTEAEAERAARTLVVGGESLPAELAAYWRRVAPGTALVNEYGPTETVVGCVVHRVADAGGGRGSVPIGRPIAGARAYVLGEGMQPAPVGVPGELYVGGAGVARGYLGQPGHTAERFVPDPFGREPGARLYRTGDRVRWTGEGVLDFLGRIDGQVKVRGYRIEPGEIESALTMYPEVREAVAVVREDAPGDRRLVAYVVPESGASVDAAGLKAHLRGLLPEYMVPSAVVVMETFPLTPNGKLDRRALPAPVREAGAHDRGAPLTGTEREVAAIWEEVLGVPRVGIGDNFFDLGGHSLLLVRVHARLQERFPGRVALIDLFEHRTLGGLAAHLDRRETAKVPHEPRAARVKTGVAAGSAGRRDVAVVGMAGRFPGAEDLDAFWRNLRAGVRSIRRFGDEELAAAGVPRRERGAPGYVPASGVLEGAELFDAAFFGVTPREAAVMNPQQRVFLECAWEALERAGYASGTVRGRVGVFASEGHNRYLLDVLSRPALVRAVGEHQVMLSNTASVATLASYKLDLEGPSMSVQTACSSSLVAVHLACRSLLDGESDLALAGGVRIDVPQVRGYHYQPGGILSPTGECTPFDAGARGTVAGSGAGVVVLKRLDDALADGDTVLAVIRGSAVTNDGGRKVGFTTPRREGQAAAIADALAAAGVEPAEISYVETHGSGTEVGDPIEVAALTSAFGKREPRTVALGAVKSSIGHLDAAAGVAGLIKTVLALQNGEIPPSPYFREPNPRIDLDRSPFYLDPEPRPWVRNGAPRRAGVSSFGLGGTNAHVVLEEAPEPAPSGSSRPWQLVVLSARTPDALDAATGRLADYLKAHPEQPFADVAHTLRVGRRRFERRRVLVCRDREDAVAALETRDARRLLETHQEREERPVVFLFPGVGDHYAQMARGLYEAEPVFRNEVDRCAELLRAHTGGDVREVLFPGDSDSGEPARPDAGGAASTDLRAMLGRGASTGDDPLGRTEQAHPAVFVVEYALARLWMSWGVRPEAMIGHSLGEYVAAAVAGVLTLEDALALLAERARLISTLPAGAMLAVPLDPAALRPRLRDGLALAAHNAPGLCTVSGPLAAVAALETEMREAGVVCRRLNAEHAFHSPEMEPVADRLAERLRAMRLSAPEVPFVSGVTGTWIRAEEATDPEYWARHLCGTVRFAEGMAELLRDRRRVLLEVGPGRTLGTFAVHGGAEESATFASLRHAYTRQADPAFLLETLGRLWMAGVRVDWDAFVAGERRRRTPLPTYPFEHRPYWVEPRRRRRRRPGGGAAGRETAGSAAVGGESAPREPSGRSSLALAEDAGGELPALQPRPETGTRYVAPQGEMEERMAALWRDLLGFDRIGAHDDFFSLGGHSLTATHLIARVQAELHADVTLDAVFATPTVAGLAARVAELRAEEKSRVAPIVPVPRTGPLPLSFGQRRLWVVDRLEPGNPAYNMAYVLRLRGEPDVPALRASLDVLVGRHESLRTLFVEHGGEPAQVVHAPAPVAVPTVDLRGLRDSGREAARLAGEEAVRPFDLERGPLLRTALLRLGDADHVLCVTMHHIVSDGWSKGLLVREVSALYGAFTRGGEPRLPELPVQYADYAVWQRAWLSGETLEAQLAYWRGHLAGAPPLLEIPTDRPRVAGQGARSRRHVLAVPDETALALRELSRREGTTLFMTLLAVWQALLSKYSGQTDVVVGSPISGRTRYETENLIGFFVNMLPLRADLSGDPTWSELLRRVRTTARGAYAHQELPFERLVEELVTERSITHAPLFQVAFALERADGSGPLALCDLGVEAFGGEEGASKFDLDLIFGEDDEHLPGALTYRVELFDAETIARLAGHLETLLAEVAADPRRRISEVSLLRGAERARVLEAWNDTAAPLPRACVHERFTVQAARMPDAPAVYFHDEVVGRGELERRSNRLAHRLRRHGVGPETRVGLYVERGIEMVVALLGIFKAGGVYVPLDPAYPAERLAFMLADSGASVLLAPTEFRDVLPAFAGERVRLDAGPGEVLPGDDAPPASGVSPENAAWVIYTSGSTGRPKGVVATHAGAANLLSHAVESIGAGPGGRIVQTASASFDASLLEILAALLSGAELHVADRETVLSPERLGALLRERRIDTWITPPALLDTLPDADFPALRTVCVGGDRCSAETAARWSRGRRMFNMYGPTETTIYSIEHRVAAGAAEAPPIGRAVANLRAYVLDASGEPSPVGVPGELHVGGAGVVRGYLGLPGLTAERFVPDAFGGDPGARLYRSGDRARWRADGALEFLGRVDAQVKIRGFRIEPGEVEAVLREQEGVRDAAVTVREDAPGGKCLVAYVVAGEGAALSVSDLRSRLGARLPEYMVPAAFVALERLPLTPSGKTDLRALPAPRWGAERAYLAPRTATESLLCGIWAEVLKLERVGVEDGFFELGGHSLLATQVVSRVREATGVEVPLRALFETPTVDALAERVESLRGRGAGAAPPTDRIRPARARGLPAAPSIPRAPREAPPLSFAQQRLWLVDRLEPGSPAYNMPFALRLRGPLDTAPLRASLDALVRRHETLRTTFAERDGVPAQVVQPPAPVPLPVLDLRRLPPEAREAEAERLAAAEALRPFDLARGPLLRSTLLRLDRNEHVLCFTAHHVVCDGWSLGVLVREVSRLYTAFSRGLPSPLPPLPVQYADYAVWQREHVSGRRLEEQLEYWKGRLAGAPALLELPTDRPRPPREDPAGAVHGFTLGAEAVAALRGLARREGTTLFVTLAAGLKLLLARYAGQDDVLVGTPVANRTRVELEGLIGFFANTLVLRTDLSGDPTVRELLGRVGRGVLEAQSNQDLPFERLVEALQPERSLSRTPLFQTLLALQNMEMGSLELGGVEARPLVSRAASAKFDQTWTLEEDGDSLGCSVTYRTALWDVETVARMAGHLRAVLAGMAAEPGRRVSGLELLDAAEREQVLRRWNATDAELPTGDGLASLFEAQAARTPDAAAVVFGDRSLTYAELDGEANRLAHRLRALGAGPEVRVGLCIERSLEMVVGVLATIKAGAAYVPLDPAYPAERLAYMLEDSGCRVLLTRDRLLGRLPAFGGETVLLGAPSPPGPLSPASEGRGENEIPEGEDRSVGMPLPHSWGRVASPSEPGGGSPPPPAPPPQAREGSTTVSNRTSSPPPVGEGWREAPGWGAAFSTDSLAYVIYTSGSTGRPRGVAMPRRPLRNLIAWQLREWSDRGPARVLQYASISFDVSFQEMFSTWGSGGTLVVVPEETRADLAGLARLVDRERIDRVFLPFVALQHLAEAALEHGIVPRALREVVTAGEQLRITEAIRRWLAAIPGCELVNQYGPSETHVVSSLLLAGEADAWPALPSIGGPVANTRLYVLDPSLRPAPLGVPGELYVGGESLARGYLERPDATAERFVPDPFTPPDRPGARLYRTGDRARWRASGGVEFLGRTDQQVKVRGFRVEPAEVEAALERHPRVREALVVAREDAPGDRRLVGYVVPDGEGESPPDAELRGLLAAKLPEYMVPSAFVSLERFPLTPSGKIDRRALPAPERPAAAAVVAPRTPTEEALAGIWAEVLGLERVGVEDDFFALGGHSLLATRVVSRVRQSLGTEVPLRVLFEARTVAALAERVEGTRGQEAGAVPTLARIPRASARSRR